MHKPSLLRLCRWSRTALALLTIAACGNRASGVAGSGSSSGMISGASAGAVSGTSTGAGIGASAGATGASGASAGVSGGSGSGTGTGGSTGVASGGSGGSGMSGGSGTSPSSGMVSAPGPSVNYELTGTWPALKAGTAANPIKQTAGALTYQKVTVQSQFLAESCAIGDYNHDGIPDISSGRRWYEGPAFTTMHIFRGGHDALPRLGTDNGGPISPTAELYNGVSDDYADYPWDMDGDGWTDIINIASADHNTIVNPAPKPQQNATAYWYKNPGNPANATDNFWTANLMSSDIRIDMHGLADVDGDGKPEIFGACKSCNATKGIYQTDWTNPTAPWTFYPTTRTYVFPFGGTAWMHGLGIGDVNGDGKPDLLERSGVWLQPATGAFATPPPAETCNAMACSPWQWVPQAFSVPADLGNVGNTGGSHMFAYDVDGDGDADIISADWSYGWGLSWYEQTMPVASCIGSATQSCFTKHQIVGNSGDAGSVVFSEPISVQVVDMDGDGLADITTGKGWLAHPFDQGDPDPKGLPVLYVFKLVRDANPPQSGKAHFEPHMIDATCNDACWGDGTGPGGTTSMTPCCSGVGRQIAIGQINPQTDGIMDICIASKLGLYVYFGQ